MLEGHVLILSANEPKTEYSLVGNNISVRRWLACSDKSPKRLRYLGMNGFQLLGSIVEEQELNVGSI